MPTTRDVIRSIRSRLELIPNLPINHIYVVARRTLPNLVGNSDILIRPGRFQIENSSSDGAGRFHTRVRRQFDIIIRIRSYADQVGEDLSFLTAEAEGILLVEDMVFNWVHMWQPPHVGDSSSGPILEEVEPIRVVGGMEPTKDIRSADGNWGQSSITIEAAIEQELDLNLLDT